MCIIRGVWILQNYVIDFDSSWPTDQFAIFCPIQNFHSSYPSFLILFVSHTVKLEWQNSYSPNAFCKVWKSLHLHVTYFTDIFEYESQVLNTAYYTIVLSLRNAAAKGLRILVLVLLVMYFELKQKNAWNTSFHVKICSFLPAYFCIRRMLNVVTFLFKRYKFKQKHFVP